MLAVTTWGEVTAIGTLVLAAPVLLGVTVVVFKVYRRVHVVHEAVVGRPEAPGREPIPSMVERFQEVKIELGAQRETAAGMDKRLRFVEAELNPNHGTSLRDRIEFIASALVETQVPPKTGGDAA